MTAGQLDLGLDPTQPAAVSTRFSTIPTESRHSRALKAAICARCHAPILRGLDGDLMAREVSADPTPISPLGEVLAILASRETYDVVITRGRLELEERRPEHIHELRRYDVVVAHECNAQPLPAADSILTRAPHPAASTHLPPF